MSKLFDKESLSKMSKKKRVAIISQIVAIFFLILTFIGFIIYGMSVLNDIDESKKLTENQEMQSVKLQLSDTNEFVSYSYKFNGEDCTQLYSVMYDSNTNLVYLCNEDSVIPYMKDVTTQYIWNTEKSAIE